MNKYFEILGLPPTATDAEIKKAYRNLAKKYHPDSCALDDKDECDRKFLEINEAYEAIKNEEARSKTANSQSPFGDFGGNRYSGGPFDFEDAINDFFRAQQHSNRSYHSNKNRDIVISHYVSLEDIYNGSDDKVSYRVNENDVVEIEFKIPKGCAEGLRLRFVGRGENKIKGEPAGDLYIKILSNPHPQFTRMGYDLFTSVEVDYLEILVGTEHSFTTIDGKKIEFAIPPSIMPGQTLRIPNIGLQDQSGQRGSVMVEVNFVKTILSDEHTQIIKDIIDQRKVDKA